MRSKTLYWVLVIVLLAALPAAVVYAKPNEDFSLKARGHKVDVGETIDITFEGKHLSDVYAYEVTLSYPEERLAFIAAVSEQEGYTAPARVEGGTVTVMFTMLGDRSGLNGKKELGRFTFEAVGAGKAELKVQSVKLVDSELRLQEFGESKKLPLNIK